MAPNCGKRYCKQKMPPWLEWNKIKGQFVKRFRAYFIQFDTQQSLAINDLSYRCVQNSGFGDLYKRNVVSYKHNGRLAEDVLNRVSLVSVCACS